MNELKIILQEKDPAPALARLKELGLSDTIHPGILEDEGRDILARVYDVLAWYRLLYRPEPPVAWRIYMMALLWPLEPEAIEQCLERLAMPEKEHLFFADMIRRGVEVLDTFRRYGKMKASVIYRHLADFDIDTLLCIMACAGEGYAKQCISRFITELQDTAIGITGNDLKAMGYRPSPAFQVMLDRVLYARLDREVNTIEEEKRLVEREFPLSEQEN
jgi:tRNA nucleotidyltransferase (CCA-adding enzyme)